MDVRRLVLAGAVAVVVVGFGIQLVPYGRAHSNPPVTGEPAWDSPRTEELVRRACFDCHS
ncbi:MAG: cytochrome C, partial [Dehalococcoidia bacterium]|nr:cytochrome C [Dehalococcoidia bacterium]